MKTHIGGVKICDQSNNQNGENAGTTWMMEKTLLPHAHWNGKKSSAHVIITLSVKIKQKQILATFTLWGRKDFSHVYKPLYTMKTYVNTSVTKDFTFKNTYITSLDKLVCTCTILTL